MKQKQIQKPIKVKKLKLRFKEPIVDYTLTKEKLLIKIKSTMNHHIGSENSITPYELFEKVYNIDPALLSTFERFFFWDCIKKSIRELRKLNIAFIINKTQYLFVLKSQEECQDYQDFLDRDIKGLQKSKVKAREWVEQKRWKYMLRDQNVKQTKSSQITKTSY